jgi:heterodisulfide reductase subunit B
MKTFQFFPGCSLKGFNVSYYESAKVLGGLLGYQLDEIDDWNCCGATAYFSISEERSFLANARNLAIAQRKAHELTVACGACYASLSKTAMYYRESRKLSFLMDSALKEAGLVYDGKVKVRHLLEVIFNEFDLKELKAKVVRPLKGIKMAPYYGCMLFRPVPAAIPRDALEQLITLSGGEAAEFSGKDKCCGGMLVNNRPDVGLELVRNLLAEAEYRGAQMFITTCPLCQINLELYQGAVNRRYKTNYKIPAIYFTQMMGYAMGATARELKLGDEIVSSLPIIQKAELAKA